MDEKTLSIADLEKLRKQTDESIDRFRVAWQEFCKKTEEIFGHEEVKLTERDELKVSEILKRCE